MNYRVWTDGIDAVWEVVSDDGRIIASGREADRAAARSVAMLAGIRAIASREPPPDAEYHSISEKAAVTPSRDSTLNPRLCFAEFVRALDRAKSCG
jgi:hypothetical protein